MYRVINVLQRVKILLIYDDFNLLLWELFLLYIFVHLFPGMVRRGVINVHDMEVVVVLHE